jgi:hypothetical protein
MGRTGIRKGDRTTATLWRDAMQRNDVEVLWRDVPRQDFGLLLTLTHITGSTLERRETRDITGGLAPPRPTEEEEEEEAPRVRRRTGTERRVWKGGHST